MGLPTHPHTGKAPTHTHTLTNTHSPMYHATLLHSVEAESILQTDWPPARLEGDSYFLKEQSQQLLMVKAVHFHTPSSSQAWQDSLCVRCK